jgi:maltose alpha-D-glucosyltransferase/alpha-amylase
MPAGGVPVESPLAQTEERMPSLVSELIGSYLSSAALLGQRTGELHLALASDGTDPQFAPEPCSPAYQQALSQSVRGLATQSFQLLRQRADNLPEEVRDEARRALDLKEKIFAYVEALCQRTVTAQLIRHHGDYHLGQVLSTGDDFVIIDFEGEPARLPQERRRKHSPLRDVAGMLRSFHYAAYASLFEHTGKEGQGSPADRHSLEPWVQAWYYWVSTIFLRRYLQTAGQSVLLPRTQEDLQGLLAVYLIEKAVYELSYELNNRPGWVRIPLQGISQLVEVIA